MLVGFQGQHARYLVCLPSVFSSYHHTTTGSRGGESAFQVFLTLVHPRSNLEGSAIDLLAENTAQFNTAFALLRSNTGEVVAEVRSEGPWGD